jgi:hypothetical protein
MVRFSDMLGGSGEPDDAAAAESPYAALAHDADSEGDEELDADDEADADAVHKEPVPMSTFETPEAVLSRLTQYASSARATDRAAAVETPEPEPEPEPDPVSEADPETEAEAEAEEALPPVGDDFLPNARGIVRRPGLGRKRHP